MSRVAFLCLLTFGVVLCMPIENENTELQLLSSSGHKLWKRFVNPDSSSGAFSDGGLSRLRTKRFVNQGFGAFADNGIAKLRTRRGSEEECEKLSLCKLHARSQRNFLAAFQLYFVNKENARLWDHRAHSAADCQQRFSGCYEYEK